MLIIEELKKIFVKEGYCFCVEILDGKIVIFVGVYFFFSEVSGED